MRSEISPERRAARQVALNSRDAAECRELLCALGLFDYLRDATRESDSQADAPSMLDAHVHVPIYNIVGGNPKHR